MAIIKHVPSQNARYSDVVDYLTKQHDEETGKPILDEFGCMIDREEFLIAGINCTPDDFAEKCFMDSLRFRANQKPSDVKTHQYIISFDPSDREKGLTLEAAMKEGMRFAKKNFPGHRILVAAHPDGVNGSGNIHVHITISSLRFEDREPDAEYMRLNEKGKVKSSEYKAGCKHQDTAKLRVYLFDQVQDYCRENGYTVCEGKSKKKVTDKEYKAKKSGQEKLDRVNEERRQNGQKIVQTNFVSKKDDLRMAIDDAIANTDNWDDFTERLRTHYTRQVETNPQNPKIPYKEKQAMWAEYKACNDGFWDWYKFKGGEIRNALSDAYNRIKYQNELSWKARNRKNFFGTRLIAAKKLRDSGGDQREGIRVKISSLRERQYKLNIYKDTYNTYADAAALALKNNMESEARLCLDKMKELRDLQKGIWADGFLKDVASHSLIGGRAKSMINWMTMQESDLSQAKTTIKKVREKVRYIEGAAAHPQYRVEPFPIDVKITRGVISFKHPDYEHWTRGKTLGSEYEIEALKRKMKQDKEIDDLQKRKQEEHFIIKEWKKEEEIRRREVAEQQRHIFKYLEGQEREKAKNYWETYVVPTGTNSFLESLDFWKYEDPEFYKDQLQAHEEMTAWAEAVGGWDRMLVECMMMEYVGHEPATESDILYELERQFPDSDLIPQYRAKVLAEQQLGSSLDDLISRADTTSTARPAGKGWTGAEDNDGGFSGER